MIGDVAGRGIIGIHRDTLLNLFESVRLKINDRWNVQVIYLYKIDYKITLNSLNSTLHISF